MNRPRLAAPVLVLAFSSALVQAQIPGSGPSTRPIQIIFSGGVTVPTGDFQKFHATGYHGDVSLLVNLVGMPLHIRPEASLTHFDLKKLISSGGSASPSAEGSSQLLGGLLNLEFSLGMGPVRPYLLAGGGITNLKTDVTTTSGSTAASPSETKFSVDGGAGLRFRLGGISGFLEGRVNSVYTEQGAINFKDVKLIPVTFGLVF